MASVAELISASVAQQRRHHEGVFSVLVAPVAPPPENRPVAIGNFFSHGKAASLHALEVLFSNPAMLHTVVPVSRPACVSPAAQQLDKSVLIFVTEDLELSPRFIEEAVGGTVCRPPLPPLREWTRQLMSFRASPRQRGIVFFVNVALGLARSRGACAAHVLRNLVTRWMTIGPFFLQWRALTSSRQCCRRSLSCTVIGLVVALGIVLRLTL